MKNYSTGVRPTVDPSVEVAQGAVVSGDAIIGLESGIWVGTVACTYVHYICWSDLSQ